MAAASKGQVMQGWITKERGILFLTEFRNVRASYAYRRCIPEFLSPKNNYLPTSPSFSFNREKTADAYPLQSGTRRIPTIKYLRTWKEFHLYREKDSQDASYNMY